jgi:hypothetical protein
MGELTIEDYRKRLEQAYDMWDSGLEIHDGTNGDLIPIKDWIEQVEGVGFIDYDGHGVFSFKRADGVWIKGRLHIHPSDITKFKITPPAWATHVLWFNR